MTARLPIFVHAWWRSASTYVWSKLRTNPQCVCYYEPLHERLSTLTLAEISESPEVQRSKLLRHPVQSQNYFSEFRDLIRVGSLNFTRELSYDSYLLDPKEKNEPLHAYLTTLVSHAHFKGGVPVLCFCRSQMRAAWIKSSFGGHHIAQIRNPYDQWQSFSVEPYFPAGMVRIALKLREKKPSAFAEVTAFERLAALIDKRPNFPLENSFGYFLSEQDLLRLFLIIWIASALQSVSHCDRVLDVDLLTRSAEYRQKTAQWFDERDIRADFSDCAVPQTIDRPKGFDDALMFAREAVRSGASSLVVLSTNGLQQRLHELTDESAGILVGAID